MKKLSNVLYTVVATTLVLSIGFTPAYAAEPTTPWDKKPWDKEKVNSQTKPWDKKVPWDKKPWDKDKVGSDNAAEATIPWDGIDTVLVP